MKQRIHGTDFLSAWVVHTHTIKYKLISNFLLDPILLSQLGLCLLEQ